MARVVRESNYRHVFGETGKQRYEDLRISSKATESCGIRGNSKFLCFPWEAGGGGALAVLVSSKFGRMPRDIPLCIGHSGPVLDFEFNPFDENLLLSCSEDLTMKLWRIPDEGLKQHMKEPLLNLEGHGKKITFCTFNPSASNIVASSSFDLTTRVWNLAEQDTAFSITMPDQVMHLKWNYNGSLLAATCKDKKLRIIDPRTHEFAGETKVHDGIKPSKVEWLGGSGPSDERFKLVTTGFTSQAERQIGIWDIRRLGDPECGTPLTILGLDQGTGALYPFFDHGTQMLYVAGKGDANVRYFEADPAEPYMHFINDFRTTVPQKAFDFLPKRCMDTSTHEIMRGIKLEATAIQPVSFKVPRKSEAFQEDLYPDAPSGGAAMGADEWVGGAHCRDRLCSSMDPTKAPAAPAAGAASAEAFVSVKDLKKQLSEAQARIAALEKENELHKARIAAQEKEIEALKAGT